MYVECEALPGVAYPRVWDNRSTVNTKTGYDDDDDFFLFFCFLFRQQFLDNPRADSRQISYPGVLWFQMCLLPFWGLAAPVGQKNGAM